MAQQEKRPDFLDRFADGLERASERLKAGENTPEYQKYLRERPKNIRRAGWGLLGAAIVVPVFPLLCWFCELMGWQKQTYLVVVGLITLFAAQMVGKALSDKMVDAAQHDDP